MENAWIQVGYARVDITPRTSVPLAGYGNTSQRMSTSVRDPLYTTCIAFTDLENETVLLFSSDVIRSLPMITDPTRQRISQTLGVAQDHIMIAATHTHSAPDVGNEKVDGMPQFHAQYVEGMLEAAKLAMADRAAAEIGIGRLDTPLHFNHIRNYVTDADGNLQHAAERDPQLQMLKITRQDKQDIYLMNWQAHPCLSTTFEKYCVSADYIADLRAYVERKTGGLFAFFQGAAGNHNVRSKIPGMTLTYEPDTYGQLLGERAIRWIKEYTPVAAGPVRVAERTLSIEIDHSDDGRTEEARIVMDFWVKTNDRAATGELGAPYGINSPYHAGAILRRSRMEKSKDITINAVRIGGLSFAFAPYEMFGINGVYIKQNSPAQVTFVSTCANAANSYIPSKPTFAHGSYEVDNRNFVEGAAEQLAEAFVELIASLQDK